MKHGAYAINYKHPHSEIQAEIGQGAHSGVQPTQESKYIVPLPDSSSVPSDEIEAFFAEGTDLMINHVSKVTARFVSSGHTSLSAWVVYSPGTSESLLLALRR